MNSINKYYTLEYTLYGVGQNGVPQGVSIEDKTHYSWDKPPSDFFFTPAWQCEVEGIQLKKVKDQWLKICDTLFCRQFFPKGDEEIPRYPVWNAVPRWFKAPSWFKNREEFLNGIVPLTDCYLHIVDHVAVTAIRVGQRKIRVDNPWGDQWGLLFSSIWGPFGRGCTAGAVNLKGNASQRIAKAAKAIQEMGNNAPDIGEWQDFAPEEFGDMEMTTEAAAQMKEKSRRYEKQKSPSL